MSIDFSLEQLEPVEVFSSNMTHNVCAMWIEAGCFDALYNSEGKHAKDVVNELTSGYKKMSLAPNIYKKLNPSNGWGDYDTALVWLKELIDACDAYPEAIVRICK